LREEAINLFSKISKTHSYWGRKPLLTVLGLFRDLTIKKGEILLEPFCGGGTAVLAALIYGARVIVSDSNPMAVFLSKVLIRPINIASLEYFYRCLEQDVKDKIISLYKYFYITSFILTPLPPVDSVVFNDHLSNCRFICIYAYIFICEKSI